MARVVFAEELGSSRNQLRRSLPIAERLRAGGDVVSFVVTDLIAAAILLTPKGIPFVAAPRFSSRSLSSQQPTGYWKILAALGYDDREFLRARVRAWITLFDWLGADSIVIDRAPTARLAAEISQRRCMVLDADYTPRPNRHSDAAVLDNIDSVARALSGKAASRLADSQLSRRGLRDLPMAAYKKSPKPKARRRVLFAWELGMNAGHLERGVAIAIALRERGHEVIFVVRELDLAERLLAPAGFEFLPTPYTPRAPPPRATVNFSDVLLICGFDDAHTLEVRVRAWIHLLRDLDPDSVVIDHAPTAQIAAYITNLPSILVNSSFAIPPLTQPFPTLLPHARVTPEQLALADQRALTPINSVLRQCGARALPHLSELFARSTQILATFKELDVYSERDTGLYVGPVECVTAHADSPWRTVGKIRVFAYMRPFVRDLESLLQGLQACDAEVKFALPGAAPALVTRYQAAHFEIHTEPIELGSLLQEADLVISYGSAGLIAQALLAGVPLLLLADVLEQIINSERVIELGAGILLRQDREPSTITAAVRELTSEDRYRAAARAFAAKYRVREPGACAHIVAAIEQSF